MILFKRAIDLQTYLQKSVGAKPITGLVPTMGALHKGHISLLKKSKEIADITVCSIFINPTQFNNIEDFKKYPVTIEQDIYLLEMAGCDVLFLPDVNEIYPGHNFISEHFDLGYLENILEGKYRPGHFQGVCQVVKRLLQIVNPDYLIMGQKDYQQCMILKRLLKLIKSKAQLVICPTTREKDGLAMSSRNLRLNEKERIKAAAIYEALSLLKAKINPGNLMHLKKDANEILIKNDFKIDYIEIANANDLNTLEEWNGKEPIIFLAAAYMNNVRLIDNLEYSS
jgi:pantoate--beta-alanine ligase